MNISPISFKGATQVLGFKTQACADRICEIINNGEKGYNRAEQKIARYFEVRKTDNHATSVSFNQGKSVYVVTGEQYDDLLSLKEDIEDQVEIAKSTYGEDSEMVKLVREKELSRYDELAKLVVLDAVEGVIRTDYNDSTNHISSVDFYI